MILQSGPSDYFTFTKTQPCVCNQTHCSVPDHHHRYGKQLSSIQVQFRRCHLHRARPLCYAHPLLSPCSIHHRKLLRIHRRAQSSPCLIELIPLQFTATPWSNPNSRSLCNSQFFPRRKMQTTTSPQFSTAALLFTDAGDAKGSARGGEGSAKGNPVGALSGQNSQFVHQGPLNYVNPQMEEAAQQQFDDEGQPANAIGTQACSAGTQVASITPTSMASENNETNNPDTPIEVEVEVTTEALQGKLKSAVWRHFSRELKDGVILAKCPDCKKELQGGSNYGTTHLRNHMKSCLYKKQKKIG
ncbi:hypothetical protein M0R45_037246 [Rubus argutus]|uniref:BED-type domain-containing protein n=1 Tax=Rubus argutus TaxID=59490 RepID=A0AAW1W2D0_RUBAR